MRKKLIRNDRYLPFNATPNPKSYLPKRTQEVLAHQRAKRERQVKMRDVFFWGKLTAAIVLVVLATVVWARVF